jgi:hypothetical protein
VALFSNGQSRRGAVLGGSTDPSQWKDGTDFSACLQGDILVHGSVASSAEGDVANTKRAHQRRPYWSTKETAKTKVMIQHSNADTTLPSTFLQDFRTELGANL